MTVSLSNPNLTAGQRRNLLMVQIREILDNEDLGFDEFRTSRTWKAKTLRQRICGLIFVVLEPYMSEVEMADWIGLKRTTFYYCRKRYLGESRG